MSNKLTVQETAEARGVTKMAVYHWLSNGLPFTLRREIGKKEHKVIDPNDVDDFLNLTVGD